jgi:metal-responsive CopG/Arc/MetJ family transcriptional regulator
MRGIRVATGEAASILENIVMATSVHIPKPLLEAVDRRAHALRISRNRLIVRALERELSEDSGWSAGFFEELGAATPAMVQVVDEMLEAVRAGRRSKEPRRL